MTIPSWYEALLLGLAAFRTWKLLADDTILNRPRNYAYEVVYRRWKSKGTNAKYHLQAFLECPYCLGFWCSVAWWGAWEAWPHGTLVASAPFAIAAVVGLLGGLLSDEE